MFGESLGSVAGLGGGGLAVGGMMGLSAATTAYNIYQQERQYDYEKDLQKDIFHREDNSIQRRVRDLQRAGLSPVLAAGNGASSGAVVSTTAPQAHDLSGDYMTLIKIANDIGMSKTQKQLMEAQKMAAESASTASLATAWRNSEAAETEKWNRKWYMSSGATGGMPTNMSNIGKDAGFLAGAVNELRKKYDKDYRESLEYDESGKRKGRTKNQKPGSSSGW